MRGVHIEVLDTAEAEMDGARTARQRKYASQWRQKRPVYRAMGVTPVMIEPADVNVPGRMAARVAKVGRHIAVRPRALPAPTGKVGRAKGEWDFEALCAAVAEVARAAGAFPTCAHLTAAGHGHAPNLLRRPGMRRRVAEATGVPLRNQKGLWSRDRIVAELETWVGAHGRVPTGSELKAAGRSALGSSTGRLFRGEQGAPCGRWWSSAAAAPCRAGACRTALTPTSTAPRRGQRPARGGPHGRAHGGGGQAGGRGCLVVRERNCPLPAPSHTLGQAGWRRVSDLQVLVMCPRKGTTAARAALPLPSPCAYLLPDVRPHSSLILVSCSPASGPSRSVQCSAVTSGDSRTA